jgi:hypothetical protein
MTVQSRRYPIGVAKQTAKVKWFWWIVFVISTAFIWIQTGTLSWLTLAFVATAVVFGVILPLSSMQVGYLEPSDTGITLHLWGTLQVPYANIEAAYIQGGRMWLRFKRFTFVPPLRLPRLAVRFAVNDPKSLVEVLNSHIA